MGQVKIERYYHISEVARMLPSMKWNQFYYTLVQNELGVRFFRWNRSGDQSKKDGTRLYMGESDVNKYREREGLEPLHTPIKNKRYYDRKDVAEILGTTRQNISQYVRQGGIKFYAPTEPQITTAELRRWFGESVIRGTELDGKRMHTVGEIADILDMNEEALWELVSRGDLKTIQNWSARGEGYQHEVISREDLLKWIKSHEAKVRTRTKEIKVIA